MYSYVNILIVMHMHLFLKDMWIINIYGVLILKDRCKLTLAILKQLFFRNNKLKKHFKFLKIFKYLNKFEIS